MANDPESRPSGAFLIAPGPSFESPVEMLLACHARMRERAALLERLAAWLPARGADAEAVAAAGRVLRYFDLAAPLHHADEDEDLYPALRRSADAGLAAVLDRLASEHTRLAAQWAALRPRLERICDGAAELPAAEVAAFTNGYRAHLEMEEADVLPRVPHLLPGALLAGIGHRMARRRQPG